jgi:dTDP-4-dehydrorhamnose reductase
VRILVTGAGGMLGQAVARAAGAAGRDVCALTRSELDVTDAPAVAERVSAVAPDAIVNCAAFTDVDGAESAVEAAHAVNGAGTGNVAAAAAAQGARLVHVSTDYVFAGTGTRPYVESDPTGPRSVYGQSKLDGERRVAARGGDHAIVRTSWLFGEGGRNFVDTMLALGAERENVDVVTDQVGCPTFTGHLAGAVLDLAAPGGPRGVLHVAGAGACSWHDFAVEIFARAGLPCRVGPTTTEAMPRRAPRPAFSVLGSERDDRPVLPTWQEGLADYLAQRTATSAPAGAGAG